MPARRTSALVVRRVEQSAALDEFVERGLELAHVLSRHPARGHDRRHKPRRGIRTRLRPLARLFVAAQERWQQAEQAAPAIGLVLHLNLRIVRREVGFICGPLRRLRRARMPDRLDELESLILENALHTADRVALAIEQVPDPAQEVDVIGTVVAPPTAALHRLDFAEPTFPEPQHMLRHIKIGRYLADGTECIRRLLHGRLPFCATLSTGLFGRVVLRIVNSLLQDRGGLEHHHTPRRNRHFLTSLGISPDALAFLAHHERTERRQFHRLTPFEAVGDFLQHKFDECGRFGARKPYLLVDGFTQISPGNSLCYHHRLPRLRRLGYPSVFADDISLPRNGQRGRAGSPAVSHYHRTSVAPQVKPPPMASSSTRSPRLMRRSATASASASGIEAADVLP